jgi:sugar transferase (PEP-CTERM system associated)
MLKIGGQEVAPKILLLAVADIFAILAGVFLAMGLRFLYPDTVVSFYGYLRMPQMPGRVVTLLVVCLLALYHHDLYNLQTINRHSEMFVRMLQALGTACIALAIIYYIEPPLSFGRGIALLSAPLILLFAMGIRMIAERTWLILGKTERILILGTGTPGISLTKKIISFPELNMKVVGFLDERGENIGKSLVNPGIIGGVDELDAIVSREKIDRVVLSLAERRGRTPVRQLLDLKFAGVQVEDAHSFYEKITGRILLEQISPSWLILSEGFQKSRLVLSVKRIMDVTICLLGLLLGLPVMGFVAVAIWLESGSPIIFRQTRVGYQGHTFEMLKFRSMKQNAEANGPAWAKERDPRVTRLGYFLRKYRLDELPQIFNILRGEMSLVGPRPERPHFCNELEKQIPFFGLRHSTRPGLTGWAQIMYQYGASVDECRTKLEHDLFYIKHMSVPLDLTILFETFKVMIYGRGAK